MDVNKIFNAKVLPVLKQKEIGELDKFIRYDLRFLLNDEGVSDGFNLFINEALKYKAKRFGEMKKQKATSSSKTAKNKK